MCRANTFCVFNNSNNDIKIQLQKGSYDVKRIEKTCNGTNYVDVCAIQEIERKKCCVYYCRYNYTNNNDICGFRLVRDDVVQSTLFDIINFKPLSIDVDEWHIESIFGCDRNLCADVVYVITNN